MRPLEVTADLMGPVSVPEGYIHLDGLLAYAVVLRDQIPPAHNVDELVPIEIPVQREPGGRFHLASAAVCDWEIMEVQYTQRRFPLEQAQVLGTMNRVNLAAGRQKNYRIPREVGHLADDRLRWWCIGDAEEIRSLLTWITHLGKRRGVGLGRVRDWTVEECEPWGDDFPVVRNGTPLRHLPADWPGLEEPPLRYGVLTYPYWVQSREEMVAGP